MEISINLFIDRLIWMKCWDLLWVKKVIFFLSLFLYFYRFVWIDLGLTLISFLFCCIIKHNRNNREKNKLEQFSAYLSFSFQILNSFTQKKKLVGLKSISLGLSQIFLSLILEGNVKLLKSTSSGITVCGLDKYFNALSRSSAHVTSRVSYPSSSSF